jgi:hypothetical protein
MERFEMSVCLENAAFEDEPMTELARILRTVARRLEDGNFKDANTVYDENGNRVGVFTLED